MGYLNSVIAREKAMSGVLMKLGDKGGGWKRRLFQRNGGDLEYWAVDDDDKPVKRSGRINLFGCSLTKIDDKEHEKQFVFGIRAAGG